MKPKHKPNKKTQNILDLNKQVYELLANLKEVFADDPVIFEEITRDLTRISVSLNKKLTDLIKDKL